MIHPSDRWRDSKTMTLHKKGSRKICKNYRGLSITDNQSRITPMIVNSRLKDNYERNLDPYQLGFRIDRSTLDNLFIYSQIRKATHRRLFALYVDLTAAFDKIPRRYLFEVLRKRSGSVKLTNILQALYTKNRGNIADSDIWYDITGGTRQGGLESPPSFVWYFDFVMKVIRHAISEEIGTVGVEYLYNIDHFLKGKRGAPGNKTKLRGIEQFAALLFADDLTELAHDLDTLERILVIMDRECNRFGLYVSFAKTFTQEWPAAHQEITTEPNAESFSVNGNSIINKTVFKALGMNLDNTNPGAFVTHRIAVASGQFSKYRDVLTDFRIKKWVRIRFLESYVRSTLLYGINAECPH